MPYGANMTNPGLRRPRPPEPPEPPRRPRAGYRGGTAAGGTGFRNPERPDPKFPGGNDGTTRMVRHKEPTTAQKQRARVGHLRGAIQTNKDQLAEQRRLAASGTADQRRKARMAQGPIIDRIKGQAAQREKEIARARKMGWTDDDLKPRSGRGSTPKAPGVAGGSGSGGGSTPASNAPAVAGRGNTKGSTTRAVTPRKRDYTVDQKNAKSNTVLGKALKMYGDPRRDPSKTGEMVQGGAKSPHHVTLTGKEFQNFKKKYIATHKKSGGANLSDWSLRAMAKMLKYKNSDSLRKTYGLGEHKPPSGG
jgi:hypothetical protein